MSHAKILIDPDFVIGEPDRRLFGSFVEHLGRCVYGGIYEPEHPAADEEGFRQDVIDLVRELGVTVIRYPGGNFVSGYNWEDGVGPVSERPVRRDLAWFSTETNAFGTNEFMRWCKKADVEPMMAVNLGTRGAEEAHQLLEYCNVEKDTHLSDLRRQHGYSEPHGVKLWCLGNEMDAPWQICAKTAQEYGRIACETGKVMRWADPDIELVACGSSSRDMATFAEWEYQVLEETFDIADYISLHCYFAKDGDNTAEFLASADEIGIYIDEIVAVADAVAARRRSSKRIMLSVDEWNVWYRTRDRATRTLPGWPKAPAILEEYYTMEDTLVFSAAMLELLNRCHRVKIACLAQLVNVIAPIMTQNNGPAWRQPIFYPFQQVSQWAKGVVLDLRVNSTCFTTQNGKQNPHLVVSAIIDDNQETLSIFCVNRDLEEQLAAEIVCRGFAIKSCITSLLLTSSELDATNTADAQDRVHPVTGPQPEISDHKVALRLPPASWSCFRFSVAQDSGSFSAGIPALDNTA
jgi:alpha-L-arabinofuranosidase